MAAARLRQARHELGQPARRPRARPRARSVRRPSHRNGAPRPARTSTHDLRRAASVRPTGARSPLRAVRRAARHRGLSRQSAGRMFAVKRVRRRRSRAAARRVARADNRPMLRTPSMRSNVRASPPNTRRQVRGAGDVERRAERRESAAMARASSSPRRASVPAASGAGSTLNVTSVRTPSVPCAPHEA